METFPTANACINKEGFAITQPTVKRYLGAQTFVDYAKINCTILITNETDFAAFADWYRVNLLYGAETFEVDLSNLYPVTKVVEVRFVGDLKFTYVKGIYTFKVEMALQEDIHTA